MTPISNRQATLLRKLQQTKHRKKEQRFVAEGERTVWQIIHNGSVKVECLFFDEAAKLWEQANWLRVTEVLQTRIVSAGVFSGFSDTDHPQGILALCRIPEQVDVEMLAEKKGIILASDAIQDPGNLGTIIRTGAWFGAAGILVGTGTVDPFNPKVVRSTAGTTGVLPWITGNLADILPILERKGWNTFLLDAAKEASSIEAVTPREHSILVVGNEANGIQRHLFQNNRTPVVIPGQSTAVESLNAAVSLGIAMYHFSRK